MKRFHWAAGVLLVAGAATVWAQPPADPPPPGGPGPRPPLIEALDADKDGKISAEELKNATAALATLDKNHDGSLTEDEYRPARRPGGPGGPGPAEGRRPDGPAGDGSRPEGRAPQDRRPQPEREAGPANGNGEGLLKRPEAAVEIRAGQLPLVFAGGHETDPRDHGRPVALIAGALGVSAEVFREAFSHVRPAQAGTEPDPEQVRQNKAALMNALGKFGITNERLDEVSNHYRYVRGRGESWPTAPAGGYAKIAGGKITGFVITAGGSGYNSPPSVRVEGMPNVVVQAKLSYGKDFPTNGTVSAVTQSERDH